LFQKFVYLVFLEILILGVVFFAPPIVSQFVSLTTDVGQLLKPYRIFRIIPGASANFVLVVIILITSFYLLRDWVKLREWIFGLSPQELEPDLRRLHQEIKAVWQTYLRGQLLIVSIN